MSKFSQFEYRKDIDGLRAFAVVSVIIFHLGYLPFGYLGVDIFFVISGYLITKILFNETKENKFSLLQFYYRRIRRIIPLVLFTTLVTLVIGLFVMLPDDLENLSQSIIATNFMGNNILLLITTGNYWDISNDFKPLMHTWSLGIEEQFYFILPLIFILFRGRYIKYILPIIIGLAVVSLVLFLIPSTGNGATKFYLIQFRFFELALGGIAGIVLGDKRFKFPPIILVALFFVITFNFKLIENFHLIVIVVLATSFMISKRGKIETLVLENPLIQYVGKISFSLYMWHQIVFAFGRYFVFEEVKDFFSSLILISITFLLSVLSYHFIENPFRNKNKISLKKVLIIVISLTIVTTSSSLFIYYKKGLIRDVPELNMYSSNIYSGNIHIKFNERVYDMNKGFSESNKKKLLIVGDSFARDWANVLLKSKFKDSIEISYLVNLNDDQEIGDKINLADRIFFSELKMDEFIKFSTKYNIDPDKVWNVGTKNFGKNNGLIYNTTRNDKYCNQRTKMADGFLVKNENLKKEWKNRYIDLIGLVINKDKSVPVFTKNCRFISSDCTHLTEDGAEFFAEKINNTFKL